MTRAEKVQALRASGSTIVRLAEIFGVSKKTIKRDLDPGTRERDAVASRDRKRKLKGQCTECSAPTTVKSGGGFYAMCASCAREVQRATTRWTRAAVIDAIQRYAKQYGRPPTSNNWLLIDRENRYPGFKSVYKSGGNKSAPFDSWADAIEAAGFPRPEKGKHERTPEMELRRRETRRLKLEAAALTEEVKKREATEMIPTPPIEIRIQPRRTGRISAHELTMSRDCLAFGCPYEAESGQDACKRHLDVLAKTG